jgi:hypothetical protein
MSAAAVIMRALAACVALLLTLAACADSEPPEDYRPWDVYSHGSPQNR